MNKILVIIGPTSSGKSALAMSLAKLVGAEILSIDSMQIYRGMDIGTAKPTPQEQAEVRHHLIDVVGPDEVFSVARFVAAADDVIADAKKRNVPLIATGGTPLYFKALFYGLFEGPSADMQIREKLSEKENAALHEQLADVDPEAATRIHVGDRKRLIRALEVHRLTGKPISSLQTQWVTSSVPRHKAVWIGLKWEKEALNRRINARVGAMLEIGWALETRKLLQDFPEISRTAAEATGYKELMGHVHGELDLDDAAERIKMATRQLARRQMKWLRRFEGVHWIAGDLPMDELRAKATDVWKASE